MFYVDAVMDTRVFVLSYLIQAAHFSRLQAVHNTERYLGFFEDKMPRLVAALVLCVGLCSAQLHDHDHSAWDVSTRGGGGGGVGGGREGRERREGRGGKEGGKERGRK